MKAPRILLLAALFSALVVLPGYAQEDCPPEDPECALSAPQSIQVNPEAVSGTGSAGAVTDPGALQPVDVAPPGFVEPAPLSQPGRPTASAMGAEASLAAGAAESGAAAADGPDAALPWAMAVAAAGAAAALYPGMRRASLAAGRSSALRGGRMPRGGETPMSSAPGASGGARGGPAGGGLADRRQDPLGPGMIPKSTYWLPGGTLRPPGGAPTPEPTYAPVPRAPGQSTQRGLETQTPVPQDGDEQRPTMTVTPAPVPIAPGTPVHQKPSELFTDISRYGPPAAAALMDAADRINYRSETLDPDEMGLLNPTAARWEKGRWGGIRGALGRARRDLGGWIGRRTRSFVSRALPGMARDLRRGRVREAFTGRWRPLGHLRDSLRGLGRRVRARAQGLRFGARGVGGGTLRRIFQPDNVLRGIGGLGDGAALVGSVGAVLAADKPRRVQQVWQDVAGVGDAVSGAVDLIRFPRTLSKAIAEFGKSGKAASHVAKLGRAGKFLGKAAKVLGKVAAPLAIVGGAITVTNEAPKALRDLTDDGRLTEEGAIAAANAAAGFAAAAGGVLTFVAPPLAPVAFAISGIIQGGTWLYANRQRIKRFARDKARKLNRWARNKGASVIRGFKVRIKTLSRAASRARSKLSSAFSAVRKTVSNKLKSFARGARNLFSSVRKAASRVKSSVSTIKRGLGNLFKRRASASRARPRGRRLFRRTRRAPRRSRPHFSRSRRSVYRGRGYWGTPGR